MPVGRDLEGFLVARAPVGVEVDHIGQQEGRTALLEGVGQVFEGCADVGAAVFGLELHQVADDVQQVAAALLGRNEFLDLAAEEQGAHLVVVDGGGEGEDGRDFGHQVFFRLAGGAEQARAAHVDEQHHREFAFLFKDLDVGRAQARRDVPVHIAHVVAVLVLAYLAEGHSPSLERGMVLPGEDLVRQRLRLDLDLPYFLQ